MLELLIAMLITINGAKYNTRALQQANYSNIQAKGGTLYGKQNLKSMPSKPAPKPATTTLPALAQSQPKALPETGNISNQPYSNKTLTGTGIQLNGTYNKEQKEIADKYSMYYKSPIAIEVVSDDKQFVSNTGQGIGGLTSYWSDGSRKIQVNGSYDKDAFELSLLHEIAHNVFHYDEDSAWNYAKEMINLIN